MNRYLYLLVAGLLLFSCQRKEQSAATPNTLNDSIYYAKGFRIESHIDYKLVSIMNPWHSDLPLQTYVLVPKTAKLPAELPAGTLLRTPLERTVVFSSVVCGMLDALDALPSLVGVAEPEYIDIPFVQNGITDGTIHSIGQAMQPDIEKLLLLAPEAVLTNPVNEAGAGPLGKLTSPTLPCLEWQENHPLGQTEWIRLLGLLFDKQALADSLFFATVNAYNDLRTLTASLSTARPTVFTEKKYGDFWYMPGGQSYFACLLRDAGADYIFADNAATGSVSYTFETILSRAGQADFWFFKYYSPTPVTYSQLSSEYANYSLFAAYKRRNIFACNTQLTPQYYQQLPLHPDWVLQDLISIFHPSLLPKHPPRYYFKVEK